MTDKHNTWRNAALTALGLLVLGAATAAATWWIVNTFVIPPNLNDPLARQKIERTRK